MKLLKEIIPYVIIVIVVVLIRTFIITPVSVDGNSMYPTLKDKEILILKKYDKQIKRFDIVVFKYGDSKLIKRVIGLPGEKVEYKNNNLYIDDNKIKDVFLLTETDDFNLKNLDVEVIPDDYYFVLGDNRINSSDSRTIGLISIKDIEGTVSFRAFPFKRIGNID